jgi:hypothetical protein
MMGMDRTRALLVLACAGGAALLAASQFTNLFELVPPGGEARAEVKASDQHGYATIILAALSLILLVISLAARGEALAQGAAFAVAVCGAIALLVFLVIDLPDAGSVGALDDESFIDAKAEPVAGFWMELTGALVLAACGAALATMRPVVTGASTQQQRELGNPSPKAANTEG